MPRPPLPPPPPRYDPKAVAVVESIERIVQRLHPDRQGEIIAILNAIECHVEEGQGDPGVLRHLTDALVAMTAVVHLDAHAVTTITCYLDKLRDRVGQPRGGSLPGPAGRPASFRAHSASSIKRTTARCWDGKHVRRMLSYSQLKHELQVEDLPMVRLFERYCAALRDRTRAVGWSCKANEAGLHGARFLHTATHRDQAAIRHGLALLGPIVDELTGHVPPAVTELLALGREHGVVLSLGYAQLGAGDRRHLKIYVTLDGTESGASWLARVIPAAILPPAELPQVIIGVEVEEAGWTTPRAYYMWDRPSVARSREWLRSHCSEAERAALEQGDNRTVSLGFKPGAPPMLYLSYPFSEAQRRLAAARLAQHPLASSQMPWLRWIGAAPRGEGLAGQEFTAYFDTRFDAS